MADQPKEGTVGARVFRALGLDPSKVTGLAIEVEPNIVMVKVTYAYVKRDQTGEFAQVVENLRLVPAPIQG